jgi:ligand-binding sensor domain-containing protein/serine phosphatase RsbU (regulator of sigma subunit)
MYTLLLHIKQIWIVLVFLIFESMVHGQEGSFVHYGLKEGLSQSVVNYIFQDSKGYMWFGTQNGLNRFDGYNFSTFISKPYDNTTIIDNWIYAICQDKYGKLWVATKKGLVRYSPKSNTFERIEYKPKNKIIANNAVNGLGIDSKGNIILNTKGYLILINPETLQTQHFQTQLRIDGSVYDQNRPVAEDHDGNIWMGTQTGLACFNPVTSQFSYFGQDSKPSLNSNDITALCKADTGKMWVGTMNGLVLLDYRNNKVINYLGSKTNFPIKPVRSIVQHHDKSIFVATENSGIIKLQNQGEFYSIMVYEQLNAEPKSLSHNIVYSLFIDKSENLWAGTLNGINRLDLKPKKFRLYRKNNLSGSVPLADNVIASIYKDKDNKIWIGTWGSGLNIYDLTSGRMQHFSSSSRGGSKLPDDFVHVIFLDKYQRKWIGTRNGLVIFDEKTRQFVDYRNFFPKYQFPGFNSNRIYCLTGTSWGDLYIGTANGLYVVNPQTGYVQSFFAESHNISGNLVYSVIEDEENNIWIATTNGLDHYNPLSGEFKNYRKSESNNLSIIDNFVVSLCLGPNHTIWIGTSSGLCTYDKSSQKFSNITSFPVTVIYDMIKDNNGNIWLSSGLGLSMYDFKKKSFVHFETDDGLQGLEFNLKACYKAPDGELFFGGMNGFNSFYPDSIYKSKFNPPIVFTHVEKENKSGKHIINLEGKNEIVLNHQDYLVAINFASLDYTNPNKISYAYELIGLSQNKIDYGNKRHLTFLNLPPGEYELKIYGTNSDGIWSTEPASLRMTVLPPWYRSIPAYFAYFILIVLGIIFYIKLRERNLKQEKILLKKKVEERTNEIWKQKEEIAAQKDEIEKQKNLVTLQRDQIARKNIEINDSILYAKRIQAAVLPQDALFKELFSDYFVFFKPKAIVSGDFYWIRNMNGKCFIAVADCTGHGVPGAFVSMLGISFLNEIVQACQQISAGILLDKLRDKIKTTLQQTGKPNETKDGLDISLVILDPEKMQLEFAGANNTAFIVHNNAVIKLIADKMPIGIYMKEVAFNTIRMMYKPGDLIYLFTDGYSDQFGGIKRKKLMEQNFITLIESIHQLPMDHQKIKIEQHLLEWQGVNEQVDDITIVGLKI